MLYFLAILLFLGRPARAGEAEALAISENIKARHLPFGTVVDPFLDADNRVTGYTRCGDSAVWTGHWLAAESFRYRVTGDIEALRNVVTAILGIYSLTNVTGNDLLARCAVPKDSPFADGIIREESNNRAYDGTCLGKPCSWIGNTSRDQYISVFFGLGVAHEILADPAIRAATNDLITRLLNRLLSDAWVVRMPDGRLSTSFIQRSDQTLSLLAIGARVNPSRFSSRYSSTRFLEAPFSGIGVAAETLDPHNSYFKFNLDVLTYYHLIKLEGNEFYRDMYENGYGVLRRTIDDHGNAHFNMIDRALRGPDPRRDQETRDLLDEWLERPRRDTRVDWRGTYPSCGQEDRACDPLPVARRVRTDFLWQRSPFLLYGGGVGNIETAGIDYILPYWMARFYGVL